MVHPFLPIVAPLLLQAAHGLEISDKCKISTFQSTLDSNSSIEKVDIVSNGDPYGEGESNLGYPNNPAGLPELCAVTVHVTSSSRSFYRFGLLLPTEWNSRLLAVGNGGFAGGINWLDMAPGMTDLLGPGSGRLSLIG